MKIIIQVTTVEMGLYTRIQLTACPSSNCILNTVFSAAQEKDCCLWRQTKGEQNGHHSNTNGHQGQPYAASRAACNITWKRAKKPCMLCFHASTLGGMVHTYTCLHSNCQDKCKELMNCIKYYSTGWYTSTFPITMHAVFQC